MKTLLITTLMVLSNILFSQTSITLVKEEPLRNTVKIYPNPVHDNLTIHFKSNETPVSVTLCDEHGRVVYSDVEVWGLSELSISTNGFKKGMYILSIKGKNDQVDKGVVIN
jgi:hypothetical protein